MNDKAKHTPGPWVDEGDPNLSNIRSDEGNIICTVWPGATSGRFVSQEECRANVQLIIAAEDLLEACKAIVDHDENSFTCGNTIWEATALCKDAIAKAEGTNE